MTKMADNGQIHFKMHLDVYEKPSDLILAKINTNGPVSYT